MDNKQITARKNIELYPWAKAEADRVIETADLFVDRIDELYDMIASQGIPRGCSVGAFSDPDTYYCRYCGVDIRAKYGSYGWINRPLEQKWKITCPDCGHTFPTNDFGSFYKLGLDEYGEFDRMRALEKHRKLFGDKTLTESGSEHSPRWKAYYGYGAPNGYLTNTLYAELPQSINRGRGLRDGETIETWGVDDSFGYIPTDSKGNKYTYPNGVVERHTYIAEYMHYGVTFRGSGSVSSNNPGIVSLAVTSCADAYFYTGDVRYARVTAILLDRIADFYPDYETISWGANFANSTGNCKGGYGKRIGCIWECGLVFSDLKAYGRILDIYEKDEYIAEYIKRKADKLSFRYKKNNAAEIKEHFRNEFIRVVLDGIVDGTISGNFGFPQRPNALGAILLENEAETKKWLDFLMAPGWSRMKGKSTGGGIGEVLTDRVCADGCGDEAAPGYNQIWISTLLDIQDILEDSGILDLWKDPKFVQMVYAALPMYHGTYMTAMGDTGATASKGFWVREKQLIEGFRHTGDIRFAQLLYEVNGCRTDGLHYNITVEDPDRLSKEIADVIEKHGRIDPESALMSGFGFAAIRRGTSPKQNETTDTRRDIWMYFGSNCGHGHRDTLNLGLTAYGLCLLPENGYPEETGTQPNRLQWAAGVLCHNTVMVDECSQTANSERRGDIRHYDDSKYVGVIDVDAAYVYPSASTYRRSVVTVDAGNGNSYTVDFFNVVGGFDHLYSIHASAAELKETSGVNFVKQTDADGNYVGSYAGADVPYGPDPNSPADWHYDTVYPRGYTWLKNVERDSSPSDKVEVEFDIADFNNAVADASGIGLRMTMLNRSNTKQGVLTELAAADALPPQKAANRNIPKLRYLLYKRSGKDLATTFTTVFEPYKNDRFIESIEELYVNADRPCETAVRAVKVTHKNGRIDHVFCAEDNSVTYTADGIEFRGFVGVHSAKPDGTENFRYILDGDIIGQATQEPSAYEGVVVDFERNITFDNYIKVKFDTPVDTSKLVGKIVRIDNDSEMRDAAYVIEKAGYDGDAVRLGLGRVTTVRRFADINKPSLGYIHTTEVGMKARVPLSLTLD